MWSILKPETIIHLPGNYKLTYTVLLIFSKLSFNCNNCHSTIYQSHLIFNTFGLQIFLTHKSIELYVINYFPWRSRTEQVIPTCFTHFKNQIWKDQSKDGKTSWLREFLTPFSNFFLLGSRDLLELFLWEMVLWSVFCQMYTPTLSPSFFLFFLL